MTKGYPRFKKEIIRAQNINATLIIIVEGTLTNVLKGYKHSMFEGVSMIKKLFTIWIRHGVQTVFTKDRQEMSEYITQFYLAVGREYVRKK